MEQHTVGEQQVNPLPGAGVLEMDPGACSQLTYVVVY